MNRRLRQIYKMIPKNGKGIIDVGTDHGQIPIQLAMDQYEGMIFASDIVPGPLATARKAAIQQHVENRIHFLLCDGLECCPRDRIDCIVIAGMGGDTICGILDRAEWLFSASYRLILQPMTHAEVVRYWLVHNEYRIAREAVICEDSHVYQIIDSVPGKNERLQDFEYLVGGIHTEREGDSFDILIAQQFNILQKKINGMNTKTVPDSSYPFYLLIQKQFKELIQDGKSI